MWSNSNNVATRLLRSKRLALIGATVMGLLTACADQPRVSRGDTPQQVRAMAMWQERCKKSGEVIHKTVENVRGVFLINVRTEANRNQGERPEDQYRLSDPYGHDLHGDGYLETFLRDSFHYGRKTAWPAGFPPQKGYAFVEAFDPKDGKLYQYTGRVEEPWQHDKTYLRGHLVFVLEKTPIAKRSARYGVRFEDISTDEERQYWIAGSSLKVIDLETGETIAERIGYMVDWAQGSRVGGRQPWTFAADNACPAFDSDYPIRPVKNQSGVQPYQTLRFVEKSLKPFSQESAQP